MPEKRFLDFLLKDKNYFEDFITRSVNSSNKIEGSKLSYIETAAILWNDNSFILNSIRPRDFYEAVNLKAAYEVMLEAARNEAILSKKLIIRLNEMINKDILDLKGFRKVQVYIKGAEFIPPSPFEVEERMQSIIDEINREDQMPILKKVAKFHILFEHVHPFIDANGRTGRLLINFELLKHDCIPIIIPNEKRDEYFKYISDYDLEGLTNMLAELQGKEQDRFYDFVDMSKEESRQIHHYGKADKK